MCIQGSASGCALLANAVASEEGMAAEDVCDGAAERLRSIPHLVLQVVVAHGTGVAEGQERFLWPK